MKLKDIGNVLRSFADSWSEKEIKPDQDDYGKGWDDATMFCGKQLDTLLDKCDVPKLNVELERQA